MDSRWSDADAEAAVERYTKQGFGLDLALRTYTTRLLGGEPRLVIHGGGNTSVKTVMRALRGDEVEVLCVKGSGWDMASIEPAGLPAVRLDALRPLADLDALSDEAMVNAQRGALLDAAAPNPSVETLLHAFLPHTYIDHTHANAVLALTDQPDPAALCREVFGETMALMPYVMPGFALARRAMAAFREQPGVDGMILLRHGIFTFGESAREAYERMIEKVTLAENRLARAGRTTLAGVSVHRRKPRSFAPIRLPRHPAAPERVAPILRGLGAIAGEGGRYRRWILAFRTSPQILDFVNGGDLARYSQQGTATPDHVIRTKRLPLITPPADADEMAGFAAGARAAIDEYRAAYHDYFVANNARQTPAKTELDPVPRVILVPGLGLFGIGASAAAANIAADLAETNVEVIGAAELVGTFTAVSEAEAFDIEYWSLEQAKLGKAAEKPLAGQVVVITGGGSGIGAACARAFRAAGAEICVLDIDAARAEAVIADIGGLALGCDVTQHEAVAAALRARCRALRRRRHRRLQRRARVAGADRRDRRQGAARELRAELLGASDRRACGRRDHGGTGHRRLPALQRVEAGDQSGRRFRPLWPAQGGDAGPDAPVCRRLRPRRHPRLRRERRSHPHRPARRQDDRRPGQGARGQHENLHVRQPTWA